jgi:hypothetical protein
VRDLHGRLPFPEGRATTEIVVRTGEPLDRLTVTLRALVANDVTMSAGGRARTFTVKPGEVQTVSLTARGVTTRGSHAYLLRVSSATGAVPALLDPGSRDPRFLGVLMELRGHVADRPGAP